MNKFDSIYLSEEEAHFEHLTITIDNQPLSKFLHSFCPDEEPSIEYLIPTVSVAFSRSNKDDRALAWNKLLCEKAGSTIVPILVCNQDLDLSCIVVVCEVEQKEGIIKWRRIGYDKSKRRRGNLGEKVRWIDEIPTFEFSKKEYFNTLARFKKLVDIDNLGMSIREWFWTIVINNKQKIPHYVEVLIIRVERSLTSLELLLAGSAKISKDSKDGLENISLGEYRIPLGFDMDSGDIKKILIERIGKYLSYSGPANFIHTSKKIILDFKGNSYEIEKPEKMRCVERFEAKKRRNNQKN